ncbi:MAG: hypothetical protein WDA23_03460 [Gemmobacter sp.]
MFAEMKAIVRRARPSLIEDVLGVAALFGMLVFALHLPVFA